MQNQNVNLMIIELAFGDDQFELEDAHLKLRANSVLWPKERMLNYALTKLPPECKYIAWIDGDVLFDNPSWQELAIDKFNHGSDVLQLFEQVNHLPPGHANPGHNITAEKGIVWQSKTYKDFINLRKQCKILYATTGFAWAAKKDIFVNAGGFYDKHVLGANDNIIIDCCLETFDLHHYYRAGKGTLIIEDMMKWAHNKFGVGIFKADYLPITIHHLFHGSKKNRGYLTREDIIKENNYDPNNDIKLENHVYEWSTYKPNLHEQVKNYFSSRKEDELS